MPALSQTLHHASESEQRGEDDRARVGEAWEKFLARLTASGQRVTATRHIVFARVCELAAHFRADELAAELARGPNRVSRGSVYRTLAILVEAGLVREVRDWHRHVYYERAFGCPRHEHMICDHCGRFVEFSDPEMEARIEAVCKTNGFAKRMYRFVVFGTCDQCMDEQSPPP